MVGLFTNASLKDFHCFSPLNIAITGDSGAVSISLIFFLYEQSLE
jgi:hypothetical protein